MDINNVQFCYDEMAVDRRPSFAEQYGSPMLTTILYKGNKGESYIYPLIKNDRIETFLLAREINEGHYISRTNKLSYNEIDGTLVSAGIANLFNITPLDLISSDNVSLISAKLGRQYSVSLKNDQLEIIELQIIEPSLVYNANSVVSSFCRPDEVVSAYMEIMGLESSAATEILIAEAVEIIMQSGRFCFCPDVAFVSEYLGITGQDWFFDEEFWADPNLFFPPQTLPNFECFSMNFPREEDGTFMYGADNIYDLVGGDLQDVRNLDVQESAAAIPPRKPATNNLCALKVSIALNKCGVEIPCLDDQTIADKDGNKHFINSDALNNWMKMTFPEPLFECFDNASTDVFAELNGQTGIVISNYGPSSNASGHADIFLGETCSISPNGQNCAFGNEVCFWDLD